ncbi:MULTISPECIES: DUF6069 family protein [unclassified Micromonospora]|uniref:DUF6069 family protein n=1 Tax=unclassified Micromonospora TaxID=2617518 RepID=UPI001C2258A3|nr:MULTISPECIES: DUF6069 family protein [unclassified Micromonospora]MBU8860716.1 hypothetical protein [Micromonospora sp. WMMB482]MDM4780255.1 DUF6069 family protein [Micromonospora sp. b486]
MPARTLALPRGARVPVVAARWQHTYGVVTRGRVQLKLRDGSPGPVLGRDAGFWLRGTSVRALRNPGRRTATVRILTPLAGLRRNDMISSTDTGVTVSRRHGFRRLAVTGLAATVATVVVTTLAAALARAAGVDFEIPDGGETIPLGGYAVVTGFFALVGVVIAAVLLRFSAHPAQRFGWAAVCLTALSMVPPLIAGGDAATTVTLIGLHLVAAAVMIPALTRSLRQ